MNPHSVNMIGINSFNSPSAFTDLYDSGNQLVGTDCNRESNQCGKIFLYENNVFIFTCIFCKLSSFTNIEEFIKHITCYHTNIDDSEELVEDINKTKNIDLKDKQIETNELIYDSVIDIDDSSVDSENHNEYNNVDDFNNLPNPNPVKYEVDLYDDEIENVLDCSGRDTIKQLKIEENTVTKSKVKKSSSQAILPFYCTICDRNLKTQKWFDRHVDECHNNINVNLDNTTTKITCECCNKSLTKETFENHKSLCKKKKNAVVLTESEEQKIQLKKDELVFAEPISLIRKKKCRYCNRDFSTKVLKYHENSHTREKTVECECCKKRFIGTYTLRLHMRTHKQIKPFKCDICDASFVLRSNLLVHIRRHNGDKRYKCDYCDKKFVSSTEKKNHERLHTGDKPYKCKLCEQSFKTNSVLLKHLGKEHSENKEYKCTECDKVFFTPTDLKYHVVLHGEKKFECVICNAKFFRKQGLRGHMRTHQNEKSYLCSKCGKGFNTSTGLNHHVKKYHYENTNCN